MSSIGNRAGRAVRGAARAATWRTGNLELWESRAARRETGVSAGPPVLGVPAWRALGRRAWASPWGGGARRSRREGVNKVDPHAATGEGQ